MAMLIVLKIWDNQISILGNDNDAVFAGISTLNHIESRLVIINFLKSNVVEDYSDVQYRVVLLKEHIMVFMVK